MTYLSDDELYSHVIPCDARESVGVAAASEPTNAGDWWDKSTRHETPAILAEGEGLANHLIGGGCRP